MKCVLFLFAVIFVMANIALSQVHTRDTSIRKTDWMEYFKHDPEFKVDPKVDSEWGFNISYNNDSSEGYPLLYFNHYVDLDGDGIEEAVIIFYSGNSSGNCDYAVFKQSDHGPVYIDHGDGYKMGIRLSGDTLVIEQPLWVGWEPNCCATSLEEQYYRIKKNKLIRVRITTQGTTFFASTAVEHFYQMLSMKQYEEAYDMLGKKYQKAHPYEKWLDGFANTISIDAAADSMRTTDSTVRIELTSVDKTKDGKEITSEYEGIWKLAWHNSKEGWLLVEPKIKRVSKK